MADIPEFDVRVVVIVPHYWGKGESLAEAWQNVRDAGGHKPRREYERGAHGVYVVCETPDCKARVDELGNLVTPRGFPRPLRIAGRN